MDRAPWRVRGCPTVAGSNSTSPYAGHREPCSQLLQLLPQTCSGLSFKCLGKDIIGTASGEADPF